VLKDGKVVEQGTQAELIKAKKEYWQYYTLQFGKQLEGAVL
jgi:ABC-type multidrug transport system fused ATPase/permease subunit